MTRDERKQLEQLIAGRKKVAKYAVQKRKAELLADVERQLAAIYRADDEAWSDLSARADAAVKEADAELAKRCRELGIPEEFRPSLHCGWYHPSPGAAALPAPRCARQRRRRCTPRPPRGPGTGHRTRPPGAPTSRRMPVPGIDRAAGHLWRSHSGTACSASCSALSACALVGSNRNFVASVSISFDCRPAMIWSVFHRRLCLTSVGSS